MRDSQSNVHAAVESETRQTHNTRESLFEEIEKEIGCPLVTFFTSFVYPVSIDDSDADIIQSVINQLNLSKGFALLINSPGGDGLAAERIINVCRSYSGTDEFSAVVAGKAKSAATMVCMGASKILMAPPSELGPVDPQIIRTEDGEPKRLSAHSVVREYDKLFKGATQTKGNLQPYLQQLQHFDARDVAKYKTIIDLADDIAIKSLESGMMNGATKAQIKNKIRIFLDPRAGTMVHSRSIYLPEAKTCNLNIEELDVKSKLWSLIYELYVRTDRHVSTAAAKIVESRRESFQVPVRS